MTWSPDRDALRGRVAVVTGATRGAGRGIAAALGEAGATVVCTGRSSGSTRSEYNRTETIEETAALVTRLGGTGIAVAVDHLDPAHVKALAERIRASHGHIDVLVNDIWGGELLKGGPAQWNTPIWAHDLDKGLRISGSRSRHLVTSHHMLPLLIGHELAPHGGTAVAVTPGWLRSEMMLDDFGITEENWRDAVERGKTPPDFELSESSRYVGRAVAALAADPDRNRWSQQSVSSAQLARAYGFTDLDGSRPDI